MVRTKIPVTPGEVKIRHVGFLEMSEFYRWLKRWLEFNGYWENNNEASYAETIMPNGKKIDITWNCEKEKTKYFVYHIDVILLFIGVNKVEIQQEDKKVKIEKGDFELRLNGYLEKKVPDSMLWKVYERIILKKNIDIYRIEVAEKVESLHGEIKAIFDQYVVQ